MAQDGVYAGTNWTGDLAGIEANPNELKEQIVARLDQDMIKRYRDELKTGIDEQNE